MKQIKRLSMILIFLSATSAMAETVYCGKVVDVSEKVTPRKMDVTILLRSVVSAPFCSKEMIFSPKERNLLIKMNAFRALSMTELGIVAQLASGASLLNHYACISWSEDKSDPLNTTYHFGSAADVQDAVSDFVKRH